MACCLEKVAALSPRTVLPKEEADRIFKQDVFDALTRSGIDSVRATVVSNIYFRGVSWGGVGAYAQQCAR
jgi:hypothetical protein